MKGWYYEGYRHSLAARGIKTSFQANNDIPFGIPEERRKRIQEIRAVVGVSEGSPKLGVPKATEFIAFDIKKANEDIDYVTTHIHLKDDPNVEKKLFDARKLYRALQNEPNVNKDELTALKNRLDEAQEYRGRLYTTMDQLEKDALYALVVGPEFAKKNVSMGQLRALTESGIAQSKGFFSPLRKIATKEAVRKHAEEWEKEEKEKETMGEVPIEEPGEASFLPELEEEEGEEK
jgi:hypothetical protein